MCARPPKPLSMTEPFRGSCEKGSTYTASYVEQCSERQSNAPTPRALRPKAEQGRETREASPTLDVLWMTVGKGRERQGKHPGGFCRISPNSRLQGKAGNACEPVPGVPNPKVARSSRAGVILPITSGRIGYESDRCAFLVSETPGGTVSGTDWVVGHAPVAKIYTRRYLRRAKLGKVVLYTVFLHSEC